jgi:methionine-rich copper-binding protein CopC
MASMKQMKNSILLSFLALAFILAILNNELASAHQIIPVHASPAAGEILASTPAEVRLTFSEEISEQGSSLQVVDAQGKQVDRGFGGVDLNDPEHKMLVASLSTLSEGIYMVKWQVTLLDQDVSQGQYYFGVGNVVLPTATLTAPTAATRSKPPASLWMGVGAVLLLAFLLGVYFLRNKRS